MIARWLLPALLIASTAHAEEVLRVCADPNNLPYSDNAGAGYENRIAQLIARDLHARVEYTWWAQRRGFARNTVKADHCDVWMGVAKGVQTLDTTTPYFRSGYAFVTRADEHLDDLKSLDDPRLRKLVVGVQMIGNDASNTPPAHALADRGIVDNVRGFMVYGDYEKHDPAAPIVDAVADKSIDVAVVWGPLAGYFAHASRVALRVAPVVADANEKWPMVFDIAVGVRKNDPQLKQRIERALADEHDAIGRILDDYHVPRLENSNPKRSSS
jgi:mxaJ protein